MGFNLRHRSFLKEPDFTPQQWRYLLELSAALKAAKRAGTEIGDCGKLRPEHGRGSAQRHIGRRMSKAHQVHPAVAVHIGKIARIGVH